jgi:G3E family GTPase
VITFIPLTGFLGAGKTTTMTTAARALQERGRTVAVITNDQGVDLVDTTMALAALGQVAEVTGGCFCCKFEDLVEAIVALVGPEGQSGVDTVVAEAVGSCTDLQATVVRPLRQFYGDRMVVAPLTTVVDPLRYLAFDRAAQRGEPESDLSYLFRQQLTEADVIAVNKLDTVPPERGEAVLARLRGDHPAAKVVGYSALTGAGLSDLLDAWAAPAGNAAVELDVDYDRYAAAEAQLAWLNQDVDLVATGDRFDATAWAAAVLTHLSAWARDRQVVIGHAKLTVRVGDDDFAKLSLTGAGDEPSLDRAARATAGHGRAVINARVACEPLQLDKAVATAVAAACGSVGVSSSSAAAVSFQPGYPQPVHRLTATGAPA